MRAGKKTDPGLISGQGSQDDSSGRTNRQLSKVTGIGHDTLSRIAKIWIVEHQLKHRRNLSDESKIKGVLLLEGFYKEKANENQGTRTDLSCVRKTGSRETDQEKRVRRNPNCVNAKLADIAGVSTDKVFRYKEILEHGTTEEAGVLYLCNST